LACFLGAPTRWWEKHCNFWTGRWFIFFENTPWRMDSKIHEKRTSISGAFPPQNTEIVNTDNQKKNTRLFFHFFLPPWCSHQHRVFILWERRQPGFLWRSRLPAKIKCKQKSDFFNQNRIKAHKKQEQKWKSKEKSRKKQKQRKNRRKTLKWKMKDL